MLISCKQQLHTELFREYSHIQVSEDRVAGQRAEESRAKDL